LGLSKIAHAELGIKCFSRLKIDRMVEKMKVKPSRWMCVPRNRKDPGFGVLLPQPSSGFRSWQIARMGLLPFAVSRQRWSSLGLTLLSRVGRSAP